ncbi:MAG: flavodoxin [Ruminococcus sp.]|nr:flavodoxin [Ruminococcus sp.]
MKTVIVYYSKHHGNTKKLLDAISKTEDVDLLNVIGNTSADLSAYDRIGFASGIYYGSFSKQIISFAEDHLPENKSVFYIYTYGAPRGGFLKGMRNIVARKHCKELCEYRCQGYDTFEPFKLVGGIAKGHPTDEEIAAAVTFYRKLGE